MWGGGRNSVRFTWGECGQTSAQMWNGKSKGMLLVLSASAESFLDLCDDGLAVEQFPNIAKDEMVERLDVVAQDRLCPHVRADVAIIHAVERIEFDRIAFEVAGKKSGVDAIAARARFFPNNLPLHVVQENRDMRNVFARELREQEFVHENLVEPVFAACFSKNSTDTH